MNVRNGGSYARQARVVATYLECAHERSGHTFPRGHSGRAARRPPRPARPRPLARGRARPRLGPGRPPRLAARTVLVLAREVRLAPLREATQRPAAVQI